MTLTKEGFIFRKRAEEIIAIDDIANVSEDSLLTFRPLKPALNSGLDVGHNPFQRKPRQKACLR